jgi:hypothetical protein
MVGARRWMWVALMAGFAGGEANAESTGQDAAPEATFRIRIRRPALADSVQRALRGAARRLQSPSCAAVFKEFTDSQGRTLQANLDSLEQTGAEYLGQIGFYDGLAQSPCSRERTLAVTTTGSRAVWVCPQFAFAQKRDPGLAEVTLLHEALHSLGLGEDPPSAADITARVVARCGR